RLVLDALLDVAPHLILECEGVHQAGLHGLGRGKRTPIDNGPYFAGRFLATRRDPRPPVAVEILHNAGHHFGRFRTHVRAGEHVAEVLVLARMLHLDVDADLIEGLFEIRQLRAQALEHHRLGGAGPDAIRARSHVVFARARLPQVREYRLAGLAEA